MSTDEAVDDVPRAVSAERAVLGSMMMSRTAIAQVRRLITAADFWPDQHRVLFAVICDLIEAGADVDPVVLLGELERRGDLKRVGGAPYLHTLYGGVATPANAGHYAMQVRAASRRRQLVLTGRRIAQIGTDVVDLDDAMMAAARESVALTMIVDETVDGPIEGLSTWGDFLREPDRPEDWIVPSLIERQDVVMVLSKPGQGKSWLSRQVALAVASGVHPFRPDERIAPQRTLLVDLENPPPMVRRQTHALASACARLGTWDDARSHRWTQPAGIDVRRHADAQLLERVIAETRPALVCLGSLYNVFERHGDDWDMAAEEAKAVFNALRGRYRCAFWIEHHMPKGADSKNPFGSSVWERWPGFGRVLSRRSETVFELERTFRGDRDVREWPAGLSRGGELPWTPIWHAADVDAMAEAEGKLR